MLIAHKVLFSIGTGIDLALQLELQLLSLYMLSFSLVMLSSLRIY